VMDSGRFYEDIVVVWVVVRSNFDILRGRETYILSTRRYRNSLPFLGTVRTL
jgi:hypothetical protein